MSEFKVGAVVRLNAGSPKMTVESVAVDGGSAVCIWFGGSPEVHRATFPVLALVAIETRSFDGAKHDGTLVKKAVL